MIPAGTRRTAADAEFPAAARVRARRSAKSKEDRDPRQSITRHRDERRCGESIGHPWLRDAWRCMASRFYALPMDLLSGMLAPMLVNGGHALPGRIADRQYAADKPVDLRLNYFGGSYRTRIMLTRAPRGAVFAFCDSMYQAGGKRAVGAACLPINTDQAIVNARRDAWYTSDAPCNVFDIGEYHSSVARDQAGTIFIAVGAEIYYFQDNLMDQELHKINGRWGKNTCALVDTAQQFMPFVGVDGAVVTHPSRPGPPHVRFANRIADVYESAGLAPCYNTYDGTLLKLLCKGVCRISTRQVRVCDLTIIGGGMNPAKTTICLELPPYAVPECIATDSAGCIAIICQHVFIGYDVVPGGISSFHMYVAKPRDRGLGPICDTRHVCALDLVAEKYYIKYKFLMTVTPAGEIVYAASNDNAVHVGVVRPT